MSVAIIRRFVGAFFVMASAAHGFNALASEPQASFATTGAQTTVPLATHVELPVLPSLEKTGRLGPRFEVWSC